MSDIAVPAGSMAGQEWTDREHLRLLSIGYWCSAGLSLLFGSFFVLYGLILSTVIGAAALGPGAPKGPLIASRFFSIFACILFVVSILFAASKFAAGLIPDFLDTWSLTFSFSVLPG